MSDADMPQKYLSVVLATHNEAHNLEACLAAVRDLADEIIIVDGDSTDGTRELAKRLGARVIETTNKPNFHINKQLAMDAATGMLIFQLDADEIADEPLRDFLRSCKALMAAGTLPKQPAAWYIRRKNHLFGRWLSKGGQYPDPVIRLYQRGTARLPQKDVHEQMIVEGEVATAPGHLLHFANPTFADYVRKFNAYTSLAASHLEISVAKSGKNPSVVSYFFLKPFMTFFLQYLRHRGYVDGMAGFVFALMSALHHPFVYLKHWESKEKNKYK